MIGEIWESSETWLNGDMFDSTMNYDFRKNCRDFFALRKISAEEFHDRIVKMLLRYRTGTLRGQLNLLDSHDVNRFLSYCEGDLRRFRLAEVFLFTSPGIPCVFYGDELGMDGSSETTLRGPMPWEKRGIFLKNPSKSPARGRSSRCFSWTAAGSWRCASGRTRA